MYEQDFTHTLDKVLEVTKRNTTAPSRYMDINVSKRYVRKVCITG